MAGVKERLLSGWEIEIESDLTSRVWKELKLMWKIDFPSILTRLSAFGILLTSQSFLGELSEFDFSSFALLQITLIRFIHGSLIGMSSANDHSIPCDKTSSGHRYRKEISVKQSRKCDVIIAAMTIPFLILTAALKFWQLGEHENVTELIKKLYLSFIPLLYYLVFNLTIQMLLKPQHIDCDNFVFVWLSTLSFALDNLLSWIFTYFRLGLGTIGSLLATNITFWASGVGQFFYWTGINRSDSGTFSALDIWPIIKLVSYGIILCSDVWYNFNILGLLEKYMNDVTVASVSAFSICLNICSLEFMVCLGFLSCACIRVSNELARGNSKSAKFSMKVILSIALLVGVSSSVLCFEFCRKITFFSGEDQEVADTLSDLSILLAFTILLKSINPVFSGAAIGADMQGTAAIVNICCYFVIGIPFGALLANVFHLQLKGFWIGILCGELAKFLVLIIRLSYIWKTDG